MRIYLTVGPIIISLLWIYIIIENLRGIRKIKKASGRSYSSLFNVFNYRRNRLDRSADAALQKAYDHQKRRLRKLFIIWIIACFGYVVIAAIIKAFDKTT